MALSDSQRQLAWEALFEAETRARYWGELAGNLKRRERMLSFAVAFLSSGAVLAILWDVPYAKQTLAILTAAAGIALANFKFGKSASLCSSFYKKWSEVASEYRLIWADIQDGKDVKFATKHKQLEASHREIDEIAAEEFRVDRRLVDRCYDETSAYLLGQAA